MAKRIDKQAAAGLLLGLDDIVIVMHKNPDGDALGSGFALCAALRSLGKRVNAWCDSPISPRYGYMTEPMQDMAFTPQCYVAVDTADRPLLGARFVDIEVELCIDHHGSNTGYANNLWCVPDSASCAELVAQLIDALIVPLDAYIARCLYTGVTSDTGCFRYANTTPDSLRLGARLIETGIDNVALNNLLFEVKSRGRFELEQMAMAGVEITAGGKVAFMTITQEMLHLTGIDAADIEGITAIPRNIEGVEAGVTLRELKNGNIKVSLRTGDIDASAVAAQFGGGGHKRAAGFEVSGTPYDIKVAVVAALEPLLV